MSRRVARALMAAFSRFVHPEILNFVSTPRIVRVEAAGDGARERVLGHVTRGATGCRRHVKAFQAGHAVIRSSAPGCELSASLVPGRLSARSNGKSSSRRTTGVSDDICPRRKPRTADNRRTAGQQCSVDSTFE